MRTDPARRQPASDGLAPTLHGEEYLPEEFDDDFFDDDFDDADDDELLLEEEIRRFRMER